MSSSKLFGKCTQRVAPFLHDGTCSFHLLLKLRVIRSNPIAIGSLCQENLVSLFEIQQSWSDSALMWRPSIAFWATFAIPHSRHQPSTQTPALVQLDH